LPPSSDKETLSCAVVRLADPLDSLNWKGGAGAGFSRREHPRLEFRRRRRTHGPRRDVDERIPANRNFKRLAIVGGDEAAG
jgi:hypothetical protein